MDVSNMTDAQMAEAFEEWDESAELWKVWKLHSKGRRFAESLCVAYVMFSTGGFEWSDVTSAQILSATTEKAWQIEDLQIILAQGVELQEILHGIEYCRLLSIEASRWVQRILADYASAYDPIEVGSSGGDVLEFLDGVMYETPELMRTRMESPELFGQICIELERYLEHIQSESTSG
jgi:hypothetical protein